MSENQLIERVNQPVRAGFDTVEGFELIGRQANMFASSMLVPKEYRGNEGKANCIIALDIAMRLGASPLAIMQNLYIVHGKPSWSSQFIIGCINSTGNFTALRYDITGEGDDYGCVAWALDNKTGDRLQSPRITIGIAKKEGWYSKAGSKWQTIPELMLHYRTATLFGRLYAPEILLGMKTQDEIIDIDDAPVDVTDSISTADLKEIAPPVKKTVVKKAVVKKTVVKKAVAKKAVAPVEAEPVGVPTEDPELALESGEASTPAPVEENSADLKGQIEALCNQDGIKMETFEKWLKSKDYTWDSEEELDMVVGNWDNVKSFIK